MDQFRQWRYHVGLLMKDRQRDPSVDTIAEYWWAKRQAYMLIQRKVKEGVYEYYAIPRGLVGVACV